VEGPTNLASKDFWEDDYYRGIEIPARPDPGFPYERCLAGALEDLAPVARGERVLEVGCSPGRWLLWYAERFGAAVTGVEYSAAGVRLSRDNLAAAGVDGEIYEADFFSRELRLGRFGLVLSLGFIEHFDDISVAFARHADFVADGGRIAIGMPNFRGLTGFLQAWGDHGYLDIHNQRAMNPDLYRQIAGDHGMHLDAVRYLDGTDPAMIRATRRSVHAALLPLRTWRRLRLSDRVNHRLISSYLLLTFTQRS
jgi:SAM-dependent methyltransferase